MHLQRAGRFKVFPIFHPAAALYDGSKREALENDFATLGQLLRESDAAVAGVQMGGAAAAPVGPGTAGASATPAGAGAGAAQTEPRPDPASHVEQPHLL